MTNSAGAITDRYAYDVFGAMRSQSGATANDFRFTGQQNDANANRGLYYLRARSYDPALGRFLQRDPLPFVQRYVYASDNPANLVDPNGLCGFSWHISSYTDCPAVAATKIANAGRNYITDEANRIGLEKSAIFGLTALVCAGAVAVPESVALPVACVAGVMGYGVAQEAQWSAICKGAEEGRYSNDTAFAKNVLAIAPLPGGPLEHFVARRLLEPVLAHGPKPILTCGKKSSAFAAEMPPKP